MNAREEEGVSPLAMTSAHPERGRGRRGRGYLLLTHDVSHPPLFQVPLHVSASQSSFPTQPHHTSPPPPYFIKKITELFQIPSRTHLLHPLLPPLFLPYSSLLPLFQFQLHAAIHFPAKCFSPKPPPMTSGPLQHLIATFSLHPL